MQTQFGGTPPNPYQNAIVQAQFGGAYFDNHEMASSSDYYGNRMLRPAYTPSVTYQGMSPPNTPPWYAASVQPGGQVSTITRSRSVTPNVGTNAMTGNMGPPPGGYSQMPVRLASRTPSQQSSHASSAGQQQWTNQCAISNERVSAYLNAQKLWERLDNTEIVGEETLLWDMMN